jgi:hypothetical protein
MGLKFPNPKRKIAKRKIVRAFPVTQAMPIQFAQAMPMGHRKNMLQYATPITYDLGLPTQVPMPIAYAAKNPTQVPMPIAYAAKKPTARKLVAKKAGIIHELD